MIKAGQIWTAVFGFWILFLSGGVASIIGTPGVVQAFHLRNLLDSKQQEFSRLEGQIGHLEAESSRLEKSRFAQEREIRKVLGYTGIDELVFDFSPSGP